MKKRTISVEDPKLRRIRDRFRVLLLKVGHAKIIEILNRKGELQKSEGFWDEKSSNFKRLHKETQELSSQEDNLRYAINNSIIFCPVCRTINKDMTYNPVSKRWYCVECYTFNQEFEAKQGRSGLYP